MVDFLFMTKMALWIIQLFYIGSCYFWVFWTTDVERFYGQVWPSEAD